MTVRSNITLSFLQGNEGSATTGGRSPPPPAASPSVLRWLPSLLSSKKKAAKKSDGASDDSWGLSYDGVKEWPPGKHGAMSPQASIQSTGSNDSTSVMSFSPVGTPRAASWQDNADAVEGDQRMGLGKSPSEGDGPVKQDARSLVGWEVEVQGLGRGVVRSVRKNIWNQSVFSVDFNGKSQKISLKRGKNRFGLPFIPVAKVE